MVEYSAYVGLDVHKETIAVAVALPGRGSPEYRGEIAARRGSLGRLMGRLSPHGEVLSFCYEAGPCGYGVYREVTEAGHDCQVVAPSLVPRKPGDRVKTDRRDALALARLHRSGDLTPVWVPGPEQEAVRDLTRAREDMKGLELKARQRLGAFLLRHGRVYGGRSRWTQAHARWLEGQAFESPAQQVVFQEYVDAVAQAGVRVASLEAQMREALAGWSQAPTVAALRALRGVDTVTAMTLLAELGDLTRFDSPRQLMGCCLSDCFVPSFPDCFSVDGAGFFGLFRFWRGAGGLRRAVLPHPAWLRQGIPAMALVDRRGISRIGRPGMRFDGRAALGVAPQGVRRRGAVQKVMSSSGKSGSWRWSQWGGGRPRSWRWRRIWPSQRLPSASPSACRRSTAASAASPLMGSGPSMRTSIWRVTAGVRRGPAGRGSRRRSGRWRGRRRTGRSGRCG